MGETVPRAAPQRRRSAGARGVKLGATLMPQGGERAGAVCSCTVGASVPPRARSIALMFGAWIGALLAPAAVAIQTAHGRVVSCWPQALRGRAAPQAAGPRRYSGNAARCRRPFGCCFAVCVGLQSAMRVGRAGCLSRRLPRPTRCPRSLRPSLPWLPLARRRSRRPKPCARACSSVGRAAMGPRAALQSTGLAGSVQDLMAGLRDDFAKVLQDAEAAIKDAVARARPSGAGALLRPRHIGCLRARAAGLRGAQFSGAVEGAGGNDARRALEDTAFAVRVGVQPREVPGHAAIAKIEQIEKKQSREEEKIFEQARASQAWTALALSGPREARMEMHALTDIVLGELSVCRKLTGSAGSARSSLSGPVCARAGCWRKKGGEFVGGLRRAGQ